MSFSDSPFTQDENLLFNAVLRPNRSLSSRGFKILMTIFVGVTFVGGGGFFLAGAWPVLGFLGFDIALVFFAFRLSYKSGGHYEIIRITPHKLSLIRVSIKGEEEHISFQTYWLQVSVADSATVENSLTLSSHGQSVSVGQFLAPEERTELAYELNSVLGNLQRNPG